MNDGLARDRAKARHAVSEPWRHMATVQRLVGAARPASHQQSFLCSASVFYHDDALVREKGALRSIYTAAGRGRPPQLLFTSFSSTLGMIHVLLPFMALALHGVMRKIDPSYLRAAGLESDPVIAVCRPCSAAPCSSAY